APREDHYVGIGCADILSRGMLAGFAKKLATRRLHQLLHPRLRTDDGFSPLLAEDAGPRFIGNIPAGPHALSLGRHKTMGLQPHRFDVTLHFSDQFLAASGSPH